MSDTAALSAIHHDRRDYKEAHERRKRGFPGDIDAHGVIQVSAGSSSNTDILTWSWDIACDLRHSKLRSWRTAGLKP
jgi:hypothetical protein